MLEIDLRTSRHSGGSEAHQDFLAAEAEQSTRLQRNVPQRSFHRAPRTGHMVHQTATGVVTAAIDKAAADR